MKPQSKTGGQCTLDSGSNNFQFARSIAQLPKSQCKTNIRMHLARNYHHHHHNCHTLGADGQQSRISSNVLSAAPFSSTLSAILLKRALDGRKSGRSGFSRPAFIALTLVFTVSLILLALTNEAHSLNCYTCSSADNPACDEAFTGRANFTDTDCEKQIGRPAKVCRKIVQYIEDKKVVIRSCGWIHERLDNKKNEKESMCYKRSGTFALMMESCVCYEDNCNHSASLVPNQSVLTLLTACSIVYFYLAKRSISSPEAPQPIPQPI